MVPSLGSSRARTQVAPHEKPMKVKALDWHATATSESIHISMSFESFEQSQRFLALIIKFIQTERKPHQILEDVAWYCPLTDTGRVT